MLSENMLKLVRINRGAEMIKEFDEFPVFYFSNHNLGHLDEIMYARAFK